MLLPLTAFVCAQPAVPLIHAPIKDSTTVSIQAFFTVGSAYESEEQAGVTHLVEHLLFRRGDPGSLDREIERLGGRLEATTHRDLLRVWCTVPKENALQAALVVRRAVAPLTADEAVVAAEKRLILQELQLQSLNPEQAVLDRLWQGLAPGTAFALPTGGRPEAVQNLERQYVWDWARRMLSLERFTLVISGAISADDLSRVRTLFEDLPRGDNGSAQRPLWQVEGGYARASLEEVLGIAFRGPSPAEARQYAAWMVAWEVLGSASGLARRAGLTCRARLDPTGAGTLAALMFSSATQEDVDKFLNGGEVRSPSETDIARARAAVEARWEATLARPEGRGFWEGALRLWGGPPPSELLESVRQCSPDEVRAVLRSLGGRQ